MKDMTEGKPIQLILHFFLPLFLGNLFQQFYNMVDSIIVGKYVGVHALAGVGATGCIYFLIIGFIMGITAGYGVRIGLSFGSGDLSEMRRNIINALYQAGLVILILTPVTMLLCRKILELLHTPEEIFQEAYGYLIVILAGLVCTMMYNLASAILRAVGDSRTPLVTLIGAALLNIVLDFTFVLGFHMGTFGVGLATVISQGLSGLVSLIYLFCRYESLRIRREEYTFSGSRNLQLLKVGLPMALQFSITAVGTIILQAAVNGLGAVSVAAMTAGTKISNMLATAMESVGLTMATYSSQNMGAGKYSRIRQGLREAVLLQAVICAICVGILWTLGRPIATLFVDAGETDVLNEILFYLKVNVHLYFFLGFLLVIRNTIQGMGLSFAAMFAGVSELIARALVAWFGKAFGFSGLCFANPVAWIFADVFLILFWIYIQKKILPREDRKIRQENPGRPVVAL